MNTFCFWLMKENKSKTHSNRVSVRKCYVVWKCLINLSWKIVPQYVFVILTPEFTPSFSEVRVTLSSVLCVNFVDHCLSFCPFSFGHCVVCSSSIYGFWLPLGYLQTLPVNNSGHIPYDLPILLTINYHKQRCFFHYCTFYQPAVIQDCLSLWQSQLLDIHVSTTKFYFFNINVPRHYR